MTAQRFRRLLGCSLALLLLASPGVYAGGNGVVVFDFPINTNQEVPAPNLGKFGPPEGMGHVEVDLGAMTLSWDITYQDLSGPIVAPGAHFHGPATEGATADIQVFLTDGDPPEDSGVLTGTASLTQQQIGEILEGLWYVNIHTELNQSGEIRGQVVPEPAGLGLLAMGGLFAIRRRGN